MGERLFIDPDWLEEVVTVQQAKRLAGGIDRLLKVLYVTDVEEEDKLDECFTGEQRRLVERVMEKLHLGWEKRELVESGLEELKERVTELKVVTLHVAINLEMNRWKRVAQWFRQTVNEKVLLEIVVDESLLGGVVILYEGRMKEFSLKNKLHRLVEEGTLAKILKDG